MGLVHSLPFYTAFLYALFRERKTCLPSLSSEKMGLRREGKAWARDHFNNKESSPSQRGGRSEAPSPDASSYGDLLSRETGLAIIAARTLAGHRPCV
jgi:hypothetical protein